VKSLDSALNFFIAPQKPVGRPNPMKDPTKILKLLLTQPVPISGGIA